MNGVRIEIYPGHMGNTEFYGVSERERPVNVIPEIWREARVYLKTGNGKSILKNLLPFSIDGRRFFITFQFPMTNQLFAFRNGRR
jgi:hypothetical protein